MPLTLKQAVELLATAPTPYKLPTLRKAVQSGKLKSRIVKTAGVEIEYHVVEESDLLAWAEKQSTIKRGNPDIRNIRKAKKASEK